MKTAESDLSNNAYGGSLSDELDALTRERLADRDPENTRKAYRTALLAFKIWCSVNELEDFPASGSTLTRFVSHMITRERAPSTIGQYIGAIRTQHRRGGHAGEPVTGDAADLLRAYRRLRAKAGLNQKQATPITPDALRKMIATLDVDTVKGQRDRLALALGFCGMLRRSELVALRAADLTLTDDGVTLLVRTSKTDKDSHGRPVPIPPQRDPDPVFLTGKWFALIGGEGHLLRRISRQDDVTDQPWRAAGVNDMVKRCARDASLPAWDRYTAHSLRAGGLTASLRAGVPLGVAARHGGWNPESAVPARYARVADQWRDNAMRGVL